MTVNANRFGPPIFSPKDLDAREEKLEITCLLNPGAFPENGNNNFLILNMFDINQLTIIFTMFQKKIRSL